MNLLTRVKDLLAENHAPCRFRHHPRAEFSQEVAAILGVSGKQVAKSVLGVTVTNRGVLAVVPADRRVDWNHVSRAVGEQTSLASASAARSLPGLPPTAGLPPFGCLFSSMTVVDPSVGAYPQIAFSAGSLTEAGIMSWTDYQRVAKPVLASIVSEGQP